MQKVFQNNRFEGKILLKKGGGEKGYRSPSITFLKVL
jgi:hypothetical protein